MAKNINTDPKDTPMLKQYLELKKKHPDAIILYRVGDFYETFCDDATRYLPAPTCQGR